MLPEAAGVLQGSLKDEENLVYIALVHDWILLLRFELLLVILVQCLKLFFPMTLLVNLMYYNH